MSLSDYELQRLANIARNAAVLEELGLGGNNQLIVKKTTKPPPKRKRNEDTDSDDDDMPVANVNVRRSTRNSTEGKPCYSELSDEFMLAEERQLNRARRAPKSIDRYDEVQAQEEAKRVSDAQKRHAARSRERQLKQEHEQMIKRERITLEKRERRTYQPRIATTNLQGGVMAREIAVPRYPTTRAPEICPYCRGEFVPRSDGSMRKHVCVPVDVVLPVFSTR